MPAEVLVSPRRCIYGFNHNYLFEKWEVSAAAIHKIIPAPKIAPSTETITSIIGVSPIT